MVNLILACISFGLLIKFLWNKNSHNVIFWGLFFQWLAINIKLFYSLIINKPLTNLTDFPDYINQAHIYSNIGLIALIFSVFLIIKNIKYDKIGELKWIDIKNINKIYICYSVVLYFMVPLTYGTGFQQILNHLSLIKFSLLFIALNQALSNNNNKVIYFIIIFETLVSFTGYFAEFKNYFFVVIFTLIYRYSNNINFEGVLKLSPLVVLMIYIGSAWSAIKMEYRNYLHEEITKQDELGTLQSLIKLKELLTDFSAEKMTEGFEKLIDRISYIDYYSATINNVPLFEAHTNGELLGQALIFGLKPRILFPNKTVTDDSQITQKYTGLYVSGREQSTSISLGYMTTGYIDFGKSFFWVTPIAIGLILGLSYLLLYKSAPNKLWALAITFPYFQIANFFENDPLKVIPPIIYFTFIAYLFLRIGLPFLDKLNKK